MKKNISINISGIIFHIEEDGYEALRKYLDSINKYFASFEDSSEILADIEGRIAEIFLSKLNEGKQVITAEDVQTLMSTMGSVSDFRAAEEQEFAAGAGASSKEESSSTSGSTSSRQEPKRLMRDEKRKILGGVCAGLAHYFNIDPVWPRLLFALLVLGSYGGLLLVYIILWIVLPASADLGDQPSIKKMFRDSENKVIGGVAAGIAAFTGTDAAIIRLLFVITGIFGFGIVLYIVFWIALPEAKSITEKIQMQGEPVTLSNIETSVKKTINEKDGKEESTLAKIILFPFRLIAMVLEGISKILGPVFTVAVDVIRIIIGIIISLIGLAFVLSLIFTLCIILGVVSSASFPEWWHFQYFNTSFPFEAVRNSFPTWTAVAAFIAGIVPAMFILLLGNSIIAKKIVFRPLVGWTLFVLFFLSVAFLSFNIPQIVYSFKEDGEHRVESSFVINNKIPVLRLNESGLDDYEVTSLNLKGYEGKEVKLIQRFAAQGATRKQGAENAQMIEYNVSQQDSVLLFDSNITFKPGSIFRAQRLDMDLMIPYNQKFVVEETMWRVIDSWHYRSYWDETETWMFTSEGLQCVSCMEATPVDPLTISATDQFGLTNFSGVEINGLFNATIQKGDQYAVEIKGDSEIKDRYDVYLDGGTLIIEYDDKNKLWRKGMWGDDDELKITITMPSLRELEARGAGKLRFRGFDEEEMRVNFAGAVMGDGRIDSRNLEVDLTGACYLDLAGRGSFMEASVTGASGLRAYGYEVKHAVVDAHGASSAKVNVTETLEEDKGMASSITHRGNPEVIKRR